MTQNKPHNSQLDLELPPRGSDDENNHSHAPRVINFVDAQTLAVRKEAIERVRHLGVFHTSKDK